MRFFVLIILLSLSLCSFGQRGKPIYLDADTLKGADTVYMELPKLTGFYALSWELYFENVGGTSDGTGILQASNDTNYFTVNNIEGVVNGTPNDTIAIVDGLTQVYWLYGTPSNKYRVQLIGTVGDTTRILSNYILKQ